MAQKNFLTSLNSILKIVVVGLVIFDKFTFYTNHIVTDTSSVSKWTQANANIAGFNFAFKINEKEFPHPITRLELLTDLIKKDKLFITYVIYDVVVVLSALLMLKFNFFLFPLIIILDSILVSVNLISVGLAKLEEIDQKDIYHLVIKAFNRIYPAIGGKSVTGFFSMIYHFIIDFYNLFLKITTAILCFLIIAFNCIAPLMPSDYDDHPKTKKVKQN